MSRSPRFPFYDLQSSLEYAQNVYDSLGRADVDAHTFFESMGFSGRSGSSQAALASLKYYGLAEGRGDSVKLTDLFLQITQPMNEEERQSGLKEAARNPKVFSEILQEFDRLPSSELLKSLAVRKLGFSDTGADRFVQNFISSANFANLFSEDESAHNNQVEETETQTTHTQNAHANARPAESQVRNDYADEVLRFKLSKTASAEVRLFGDIDTDGLRRLITLLGITAEVYEEKPRPKLPGT